MRAETRLDDFGEFPVKSENNKQVFVRAVQMKAASLAQGSASPAREVNPGTSSLLVSLAE